MHYSKFSVSGRKCSCTHRTQIKGINQYIESPLQLETDHISSPAFEEWISQAQGLNWKAYINTFLEVSQHGGISVSYCCVTNYCKTQQLKPISICYCLGVCRATEWLY